MDTCVCQRPASPVTMMRNLLVLLVVAGFATTINCHRNKLLSSSNRKANFDYFYLVRQWPATFCNDHYCTHHPPNKYVFTVHGLWPQRRDGTWPEFCDPSSHLNIDSIDDLVDDMEKAWPSWSSADEEFWDHEWFRHGTCAAPVVGGQHAFFQAVLALHSKFNIQDALTDARIKPSNSRRYPVQDIKDALDEAYGVMPHVTCDNSGALAEVWMCFNKKLKAIDCVDGPHPHANTPATSDQSDDAGDIKAAPVPPNYNCNMVTIPKLRRRTAVAAAAAAADALQHVSLSHEQTDDAAAAADDDDDGEEDDAAAADDVEGDAGKHQKHGFAQVTSEHDVKAAGMEQQQLEQQAQPVAVADTYEALHGGQLPPLPHSSTHLPLLGVVVLVVVAAAVLAAFVVLKVQSGDGAAATSPLYEPVPVCDADGQQNLAADAQPLYKASAAV